MIHKQSYDVIIVGAGPAGSTLAYELANSGIDVLILEKERLPRYKCCGGGITFKTAKLLPPEIHQIFENTIYGIRMSFSGEYLFDNVSGQPIIYTVMRDKLDYALAKRAEDAGAVLLQATPANKILVYADYAEVMTDSGPFRSRFLIGADGANSITAREVGIKVNAPRTIAIESEVRVSDVELEKWRSLVALELGRVATGYSWVFPKADHLSIGIGCMAAGAKNLKQDYKEFIGSFNFENPVIEHFSSAVIPVCNGKHPVGKGRAILVGDAAGLCDPLTGEGIYNAVTSANLAAATIKNALASNSRDLSQYTDLIYQSIMREMRLANSYSKLIKLVPRNLLAKVKGENRVWQGCCNLLRGEANYFDINHRLNSVGGVYKFVLGK